MLDIIDAPWEEASKAMVWSRAANGTAGDPRLPRHEGPAQTLHCTGRRQRRSSAG